MVFLINATNIKNGGGLQVTQSICHEIKRFKQHRILLALSSFINIDGFLEITNEVVIRYNIKNNWQTLLLGRDKILDRLVEQEHVDAVLTVFGPSRWRPRVPHLCGFARAQLLKDVNPSVNHNFREKLMYRVWTWGFRRSSDTFYTENAYISDMLPKLIKGAKVYTVTNYYNQVFDQSEKWKRNIKLPEFDGVTCLSVSSPSSHKNFGIIEGVVRYLREVHPDFNVRFVLTFSEQNWPMAEEVRDSILYVGKTEVSECPYLYEQADIMFMPTLLECFTATYPEAMRMEVPIVTTDLEFARGLCGEAACYYSALDAKAAAEAIYKVTTDKEFAKQLIASGKEQLKKFDNYEQRVDKLIGILEEMVNG